MTQKKVSFKAVAINTMALREVALAGLIVLSMLTPTIAQAPRPALTPRAGSFGTTTTGATSGAARAPGASVVSGVSGPSGIRRISAPTSSQSFVCQLLNERGRAVYPSAIVRGNGQTFLLGADCLYMSATPLPKPDLGGTLNLKTFPKPAFSQTPNIPGALTIPVHEFVNLLYCPLRQSVFVLDKSGDIFEFDPIKKSWAILRANLPGSGSPDPEYIDFCLSPSGSPTGLIGPKKVNDLTRLNLLDPERNQIWKLALKKSGTVTPVVKKSFAEVMPWRVKRGDPSVAESIALTYDSIFYVLRNFGQSGQIAMISPVTENMVLQTRLAMVGIHGIRPTRMVSQPGLPLYIVERENNRVLAVDKKNGASLPFLFTVDSDLRGLTPDAQGFWVIDGPKLTYRLLSNPDSLTVAAKPPSRTIDERLKRLTMPIVGITLPRHAGVYPGARRLYRYGVHEGMDFFYGGGKVKIYMGSPVVAAGSGKIIRADANFQDMNQATLNRVMADCVREHQTSDKNEDLLRGCQVWIDHGDNMITRYAHLNKINSKIKVGQTVKRGDLLGFVGVSGTGQNLPGKAKYPHLHFEIWLDGKYLGYGLTPAETVGIFENIFGTGT